MPVRRWTVPWTTAAALLSGSGPSVFALFADEKDAAAAEVAVRAAYHDATVCLCRPARKMTMDII